MVFAFTLLTSTGMGRNSRLVRIDSWVREVVLVLFEVVVTVFLMP